MRRACCGRRRRHIGRRSVRARPESIPVTDFRHRLWSVVAATRPALASGGGTPAERPRRTRTAARMTWAYLLFAVVVGGLSWSTVAGAQWHSARVLFWIDLVLGVLCLFAVPFRRRWPLAV